MPCSKKIRWGHDYRVSLDVVISFEMVEEEEHVYQTLFEDHLKGEGITINPLSSLV